MAVVSDNPLFYTFNNDFSNITINNCIFETNRKGIKINGSSINITNNEFKRKSGVGGNLDFINISSLSGTNNITNNTFTDTKYRYGFDNCIKIDNVNNIKGTLNISNNTITNLRGSIYKQKSYNSSTDKININIENNIITSSNNIKPIYLEITNINDLHMLESMIIHNNSFTNNSGKNKDYTGLVYLARNIYSQNSNLLLKNPNGKFDFDNNSITSYSIKTTNYYGENGFNVHNSSNELITNNHNVRNENLVLLSEDINNSNHFRELYSIQGSRIVNKGSYINYELEPVMIVTNHNSFLTYNINFINYNLTQREGIAYLINSGISGAISKFSFEVLDNLQNKLTNFSENPIQIELKLPNANISNTYKIYKLNIDGSVMSPQPTNYPINITYDNSIERYTLSLPSLSNYIIIDDTPPEGSSGGDPHIRDIDGHKITLDKDWTLVKLFESKEDNIQVIGHCGMIDFNIIQNMHRLIVSGLNIFRTVNINKDKYLTELTYFTRLQVIQDNEVIIDFDLINDSYINNNELTKVQDNSYNEKGLYSLTHRKYLLKSNEFKSYWIPIKCNYIIIKIDKFWDELNEISLIFNDRKNIDNYSGEWFKHNINNKL